MRAFCSLFVIIFLVSSCTSYPEAIEEVLQQAGKNRKELEEVLKYYGKNPADSLKLRAAEFLIVNMPGKYSEYYDAPWNDVATVHLRWTSSSDKGMVLDSYQMGEPIIQDDVTNITAKYLINNIEISFMVWQEMPWGKDIPFDVFCEEILPYRVGTEPLENWREKVLASFADLYRSFMKNPTITSVQACSKVNDILPRFRMDKDFPDMSYSQLMASTRGTCDAMADLALFAMRGLGIPVTFDFTHKYIGAVAGHSWNSVRDSSGNHISFMGCETNPGEPHQGTIRNKAKVYRRTYRIQQNVALYMNNIPPLLQDVNNIVDVTSEYGYATDVKAPLLNSHLNETGYVFLATHHRKELNLIGWGTVNGDHIQFLSVNKNILYQPVFYNRGVLYPASHPFLVNEDSICRFFNPDSMQIARPFMGTHILSSAKPYTLAAWKFDIGGPECSYRDVNNDGIIREGHNLRANDPYWLSPYVDIGSGGIIEYATAGDWVLYTVEVEDEGDYLMQLEFSDPGFGSAIIIEVDGKDVLNEPVVLASTGDYTIWRWGNMPQPIRLTKGTHRIKLMIDAAGSNFRNFRFTYYQATKATSRPFNGPHTLTAAAPYVLKAVDFDFGGMYVAYFNKTAGNVAGNGSGTKYRTDRGDKRSPDVNIEADRSTVRYNTPGDWLIYTVEAEEAGDYLVELEYSQTFPSTFRFKVDGKDMGISDPFPTTGGWDSWAWQNLTSEPIRLTAGTHRIKLIFHVGAPNIRNFRFTYQP